VEQQRERSALLRQQTRSDQAGGDDAPTATAVSYVHGVSALEPSTLSPVRSPAEFASALARIDDCIRFFTPAAAAAPGTAAPASASASASAPAGGGARHKEAPLMLARFRALQQNALGLVRDSFHGAVDAVALASQRRMKELARAGTGSNSNSSSSVNLAADAASATGVSAPEPLFLAWRTHGSARPTLRLLLALLERRALGGGSGSGGAGDDSASAFSLSAGAASSSSSNSSSSSSAGTRKATLAVFRDCVSYYFARRVELLGSALSQRLRRRMEAHTARHTAAAAAAAASAADSGMGVGLLGAIRHCASDLARALTEESQLYSALLVAGDAACPAMPPAFRFVADGVLATALEEVSGLLVDTLRPALLASASIDELADAVAVLRDEVAGELLLDPSSSAPHGAASSSASRNVGVGPSSALAPLGRAVMALVKDAQERLALLAEGYISAQIERHAVGATGAAAAASGATTGAAVAAAAGTPGQESGVSLASASAVAASAGWPRSFDVSVPTLSSRGQLCRIERVRICSEVDFPGWALAYFCRLRSAAVAASTGVAGGTAAPALFDSWYPVLERTLTLLSKLYRTLDRASFETIAQDAVASCTQVLLKARAAVERASCAASASSAVYGAVTPGGGSSSSALLSGWLGGSAPNRDRDAYVSSHAAVLVVPQEGEGQGADAASAETPAHGTLTRGLFSAVCRLPEGPLLPGPRTDVETGGLDGDLFLVRSLLTLREQLSPFRAQLEATERGLDFAPVTETLGRLFGFGRRGVTGTDASSGAVDEAAGSWFDLLSRGLPRVAERRVDCRHELENLLRAACEAFLSRSKLLLGKSIESAQDAVRRAIKTHAAPVAAAGAETAAVGSLAADSLAKAVDVVASQLNEAYVHWPQLLPAIRRRVGLYLGSSVTASVLFKPVREHIQRALAETRQLTFDLFEAVRARVPDSVTEAALATKRSVIEQRLTALAAALDESDQLVMDPTSPSFGFDDSVVGGLLGQTAA
jgi:hypothetical protein